MKSRSLFGGGKKPKAKGNKKELLSNVNIRIDQLTINNISAKPPKPKPNSTKPKKPSRSGYKTF